VILLDTIIVCQTEEHRDSSQNYYKKQEMNTLNS
jgi:hypothetical protein